MVKQYIKSKEGNFITISTGLYFDFDNTSTLTKTEMKKLIYVLLEKKKNKEIDLIFKCRDEMSKKLLKEVVILYRKNLCPICGKSLQYEEGVRHNIGQSFFDTDNLLYCENKECNFKIYK